MNVLSKFVKEAWAFKARLGALFYAVSQDTPRETWRASYDKFTKDLREFVRELDRQGPRGVEFITQPALYPLPTEFQNWDDFVTFVSRALENYRQEASPNTTRPLDVLAQKASVFTYNFKFIDKRTKPFLDALMKNPDVEQKLTQILQRMHAPRPMLGQHSDQNTLHPSGDKM
jgi:hypothetical protein